MMFKEKYIRVNNTKIRYFDEGKGKAVILVHGLGGASVNWFRNIKPLSQKYRVIVPDLPSFGKSEIPEVDPDIVNYDFLTEFLKDFLESLKIKKVSVVGNSMGGAITINFALKYYNITEKLIIVDGAGLGKKVSLYWIGGCPVLNRIFFKIVSKEFIARRFFKSVVHDPKTLNEASLYAFLDWIKKPEVQDILAKVGPRGVGLGGQQWLFVDNLEKLSLPALIIWGKNDRLIPLEHGLKAHELIKDSKLVVFDECGHMPHIEKPREFNKVLMEFLDD